MNFVIKLDGTNAAQETEDLQRWIIRSRVNSLQSVKQERQPPSPGEQGPTLLAILTVVLSGPAVIELAKSVQTWIQTRKRTIKITIAQGDREITIEADNPTDVDALIDKARGAFPA